MLGVVRNRYFPVPDGFEDPRQVFGDTTLKNDGFAMRSAQGATGFPQLLCEPQRKRPMFGIEVEYGVRCVRHGYLL
jgi:hypothetical protein